MRYIRRIEICNFQSHAHSVLEFSPGLNIITGPTDNGKSAVLRALYWVLYNRPQGTDHVRHGCRECWVRVTMSDGWMITRELTLRPDGKPARNRYTVTSQTGETQTFEGFGATGIPAAVIKAHGAPQVLLDGERLDRRLALSFGTQLEGPFLLTETGSMRASAIGRLLGVHVVDAAIANLQRDLLAKKQQVESLESDLLRYDDRLSDYADLPEQEARVNAAEAARKQLQAVSDRQAPLSALSARYQTNQATRVAVEATLQRLTNVDAAALAMAEAGRLQERLSTLAGLRSRWQAVQDGIAATVRTLAATAGVDKARTALDQATVGETRRSTLTRLSGSYQGVISGISAAQAVLCRTERLPEATSALTEAATASSRAITLARVMAAWQEALNTRQRVEQAIARTEGVAAAQTAAAAASEVGAHVAALTRYRDRWFGDLLRHQERINAQISRLDGDLGPLTDEYAALLQEHKTCPTCGQPVDAYTAAQIAAELRGGHTHAA